MINARENYEKWLAFDALDAELKQQLIDIKDDENEINERF